MNVVFALDGPRLVLQLTDAATKATISVPQAQQGVASITRALDSAARDGYGECFWPATEGGHYWWIFRREAESLEVVALWSRGGASGWQHVFRAVDAVDWVRERVSAEAGRLGLDA